MCFESKRALPFAVFFLPFSPASYICFFPLSSLSILVGKTIISFIIFKLPPFLLSLVCKGAILK